MGRTKKVGVTGRFGPRYGSTIRKRVREIEEKTLRPHKCPSCASLKVKKVSVGVWACRKCGYTFAGGAWIPQTDAGKTIMRVTKSIQSLTKSK
ncbi:MAG: 50S ribosomal protein L37ae [Candidatus Odinarchaeia archaeon]